MPRPHPREFITSSKYVTGLGLNAPDEINSKLPQLGGWQPQEASLLRASIVGVCEERMKLEAQADETLVKEPPKKVAEGPLFELPVILRGFLRARLHHRGQPCVDDKLIFPQWTVNAFRSGITYKLGAAPTTVK